MAAYYLLQRNINETMGFLNNEKGRRKCRRPLWRSEASRVYSAATLRGGSSAPESWISAT
jgi:hypothetical protein